MTGLDVLERAYDEWRRGLVVPTRITAALDMGQLYGPEVDERCGVTEPAVDQWEDGLLYPTWDQLVRLSALTDFKEHWFTHEAKPEHQMTPLDTSLRFHMPIADFEAWCAEPLPLLAFPPHIVADCHGTEPDIAELERRAGYSLTPPAKQLTLPI